MTNEMRMQVRTLVDAAVRARLKHETRSGGPLFECRGCGTSDRLGWTLGCATCRDRHRFYCRRGHPDPLYYERRRAEHIAASRRYSQKSANLEGT